HDPAFPLPGGAAEPLNLLLAFVQLAGYQDFVWGAEVSAPVNLHAQFLAVCRRSKMVAMGTRSPRRDSRLCRRWALKWREDGQLLSQCLRATNCDKLSENG